MRTPRRVPDPSQILQGLTTAVVVLDDALLIAQMNAAAESLLGVSARRVSGRAIGEFVHPSTELVALCQRALATGLTFGLHELTARVGDHEVVLDCRAAPLEHERFLLLELFDTERDRKVRREAALVAQQQLSRRIVRQLAHEVKNPLGGLRGAAQLLERQLPQPDLRAYTRVIIEEADRLASLVDGILLAGGAPKLEELNLHRVTEHVARLIEAEKPAGVELVRDYDPSLPPLQADRNQLIQAFLNIARNALQAVGARGRLIFRTRVLSNVALGGESHRLVLSAEVEDTGPGIPEEIKETIFYPLVTGKPTGTGLGLTIAQDLVARHGGLIEFTSQPGRTVFQLRLPVTVASGDVGGRG
ncbi:MAG TPA: nitrogen regulation protein NR(II) [Gammaproteobacteria bacterium]|nr:nitrogen regulation protein NR(II) [Gammaproteobacteria bacterium]